MPTFKFKENEIYYEVHGEIKDNPPLLILNGIMMSTKSWAPFIKPLSLENQVILVDFLDQGASSKLTNQDYKQDIQVEVVLSLIKVLDLDKVNLLGISYGGEVAIQFAVKHQDYINKLLLFNTAASTNAWLHDIGRAWIDVAKTYNAEAFYNVCIPVIYSPNFYNANIDWMNNRRELLKEAFNKSFLDAMVRLIKSAEGYDQSSEINTIYVPTLIAGAEQDYLTPLGEQEYLYQNIKQSNFVKIPECGHASMYEQPDVFISLVKGFINAGPSVKIV
ncbi:alpha/beta fold hydrolase [Haloplasma contractile]|uniref:2-succinyl-6-hydroxy-2 4-cyclohexadiene-1-carboxylate synthase protein n=1 Tax=Haloplasma contractile SSD-17B TaxID=1033810 RepID=U2FFY2_9MOLU|nr:alpha/beta hydrolase [Haloplasma contractile]ERJ11810.1 2-succinyl-6-hydroxy-2 4-cyclohexadiene-1-carboxylate synthase protein [Haloplasma contractile SSD-17B]